MVKRGLFFFTGLGLRHFLCQRALDDIAQIR